MIDPSLLTAHDFIGIRAALVAQLGNDMNRAGVLTRIFFRTQKENRDNHERDGKTWWRTTYQKLAEETGLTVNQVKRIVPWLVQNGYVETQEFRLDGITDRTLSMRVLTDSADSHSRSADLHLDGADSHSQGSADSHSLPSVKKEEVPGFEMFWSVYPRQVAKATAVKAWKAATKKASAEVITSAAGRYAATVANSEERFIAHPSSWLNAERWNDFPEEKTNPHRNPLYGASAEERRLYYEAEAERERKRLEHISRYGRDRGTEE